MHLKYSQVDLHGTSHAYGRLHLPQTATCPVGVSEQILAQSLADIAIRMAEIAFGLLCSCLVVLPRLYQHLASIRPYPGMGGETLPGEGNARHGRAETYNAPAGRRGDWLQLQEAKSLPAEQRQHAQSGIANDRAMGKAIEGTVESVDIEKGIGRSSNQLGWGV